MSAIYFYFFLKSFFMIFIISIIGIIEKANPKEIKNSFKASGTNPNIFANTGI